jgi:hypothetical protein
MDQKVVYLLNKESIGSIKSVQKLKRIVKNNGSKLPLFLQEIEDLEAKDDFVECK